MRDRSVQPWRETEALEHLGVEEGVDRLDPAAAEFDHRERPRDVTAVGILPVLRECGATGLTAASPGHPIRMSNSNMDQAKGRIKQAAGDLTDNDDLKREGKADEAAGKVKGAVDKVADKAGDAVDKVKNKLTGN